MKPAVRKEIEELRKLKTKALKERYHELFGEDSPSSNRVHLFRRVAWRLQARSEGDLSERARRRADELAQDIDLRVRAPRRFWNQLAGGAAPERSGADRDPRLPAPGTVVRRLYRGDVIEMTVREQGFEYQGKTYASLSCLAHEVTGTRWNGFLFFGLNVNKHG